MKILFFIESLRSGGKERRLVELIKGFKKYPDINCELVLTRKDIHYKDIFSTGIKIHYIVRKHLKKDPRLFFFFYKICKKYKPDIIHVWGNMVAIYAIPAKLLVRIPMINNEIVNAPDKVNKGLLSHKFSFPFSDLIIANSKAGLVSYSASADKSIVIYNGFDFNRIKNIADPLEIRKKFDIQTRHVIGMVASFSESKDYATYIKAANLVIKRNRDITFLCVGSGDDSYFRKLVKPEYKDNIKFISSQENVESIMNVCDIGVLATFTEGVSNSIMEFMALGKPVIATDGGGTKELVIESKTGFLVQASNPEKLATKISFLAGNPVKAKIMGSLGKEIIKSKFGIDKMVKSYYSVYSSLINIC